MSSQIKNLALFKLGWTTRDTIPNVYDSTITYAIGEQVDYENKIYTALQSALNKNPITETSYWSVGANLSKTGQTVNLVYDQLYKTVIEQFDWSFLTVVAKLTTPTTETEKEYKYSYTIPVTYLRLVNIYSDSTLRYPIIRYSTIGDKIYCDTNTAIYFKYITKTIVSLPSYFVDYFVYRLASELCMNLTGDSQLLQILEAKMKDAKALAFRIDGRQVQPKKIKGVNKYLAVRTA